MSNQLPKQFEAFKEQYPEVWKAYKALGDRCMEAGPLDPKTQRLVKLGIAMGLGSEGAVHSHARRALEADISPEAIRQVALLMITTGGFPHGMAALSWVNDVLGETS